MATSPFFTLLPGDTRTLMTVAGIGEESGWIVCGRVPDSRAGLSRPLSIRSRNTRPFQNAPRPPGDSATWTVSARPSCSTRYTPAPIRRAAYRVSITACPSQTPSTQGAPWVRVSVRLRFRVARAGCLERGTYDRGQIVGFILRERRPLLIEKTGVHAAFLKDGMF